MTRSVTLADLRVADGLKRIRGRQIVNEDRSATLDDLIQVLESLGAKRVDLIGPLLFGDPSDPEALLSFDTGPYLVLPLNGADG